MKVYIYPENLREEAYKYRKVTIKVKRPKETSDAKSLIDTAIKKADEFSNSVVAPDQEPKDIVRNILANKKAVRDVTESIIVLPLPNTLSDSQDHMWDQTTSILGSAGQRIMETSIAGAPSIVASRIPGKLGGVVNSIFSSINDISIDRAIAQAASSANLRKPLFDPGYFQNYSGSNLRTFNIDWDLVPNNPSEAEAIMAIILKLKQYSSPSKVADSVSLLAPYYLDIEISNKYLTSMIKLDRVVIKNITVDYSPDGAMQQTADGMPKYIKLSLSLESADMTTSQDFSTRPIKSS